MKQIILSTAFILECMIFDASSLRAQPFDTSAWWLVVSPTTDDRTQDYLDALVDLVKERGKVPAGQISRLEGEKCTREGVRAAIAKKASLMQKGDRLLFLYRGFVTKPRRLNAIYFLTHGAASDSYKNGFEIRQLNAWVGKSPNASMLAIIDGLTNDRNLMAFYANREAPGDAAYVSIQPAAENAGHEFTKHLLEAFQKDTADLDENRRISIGELHEYITSNAPPQPGILAPTGNIEATILKLRPMLSIVTIPDGASIFLNGIQSALTPYHLIDNLNSGIYEAEVRKAGYLIPPSQSTEIDLVQGQATRLSWDLESIAVFGDVKASDGTALVETRVWIDETEYERSKQIIGENQRYRLFANVANESRDKRVDTQVLEPNRTYSLHAESGSFYHVDTTFTLPKYESIRQDLTLEKMSWFEVAQMRFNREEYEESIAAFQNGIEDTTDFPAITPAFTQMLFDSFSLAVDRQTDEINSAHVVAAAKLADRLSLHEHSKIYWTRVKSIAAKGSQDYILATERLRILNMSRYLINISIVFALLVVLISGVFTLHRHRRKARSG
ncbi:MAG: hypothetical protein OXP71_00975 [Candidatus Poribacteria bacterium]|nr:hypothetical protein [Candidatus Poribacteria bacterium]